MQSSRASPSPRQSWRYVLEIHPAAALFPSMSTDELRVLGEDIKKNGLQSPIVLWLSNGSHQLLDGRNRLDAMEAVGLDVVNDDGEIDVPLLPIYMEPPIDPVAYVVSANIHRRHLTAEQREEALTKIIALAPEKSDRQFAKEIGVDHKTIGRVRAKGEDVGSIPHVSTRTDTKGRKQPVRRIYTPAMHRAAKLGAGTIDKLKGTSLASAREQDDLVRLNRGAPEGEHTPIVKQLLADAVAGRNVSAITRVNGMPSPRDDIGSNSASEVARLQARVEEVESENWRLQRENQRLQARVEEAKSENRRLKRENGRLARETQRLAHKLGLSELENAELKRETKELRAHLRRTEALAAYEQIAEAMP